MRVEVSRLSDLMFWLRSRDVRVPIDDQLYLRILEPDDAVPLFSLIEANRYYLRRWLPWLDTMVKLDDALNFIEYYAQLASSNNGFQAGIWKQEMLIGIICFYRVDWANRSANIGYWLGEQFQGCGIMTRACSALIEYGFRSMHLHRLEIRCAVENRRSRAIPERLGFSYEGRSRDAEWLYDHFVDHAVYSKLAVEE